MYIVRGLDGVGSLGNNGSRMETCYLVLPQANYSYLILGDKKCFLIRITFEM